jgi:hypothetical protein
MPKTAEFPTNLRKFSGNAAYVRMMSVVFDLSIAVGYTIAQISGNKNKS